MKRLLLIGALLFLIFFVPMHLLRDAMHEAWNTIYEEIQTMIETIEDWAEQELSPNEKEIEKPLLEEPVLHTFSVLNIEIGTPFHEVEEELGQPERISVNEYGTNWHTYHDHYRNFLKIMFDEQKKVAGLFTNQDLITSRNGIRLGVTKEEVENILGPPLTRIQKGMYYYQLREDEDYQIFFIDHCYVTIFYDKHNNNALTSILIVSKDMEDRKKNLYADASRELRNGFEYQLFDLTNATRVRFNLPPLKWDERVRDTARKHSIDMAENNYFNHTNLQGKSPFDRMREDKIYFTFAGENLAYGQFNSIFAHEGLMNSMGHRENILQSKFEYIGIGVAFNSQSQPFFTEKFYKK